MRKAKLKILKPSLAPCWRYSCGDGEVAIYIPNGGPLTVERANILLDYAKKDLLSITED